MNWRSAMASARARTLNERFLKSAEDVVNRMAMNPWHPERVSTGLAKYILLKHATLLCKGILYSTHVRNIGAGVKELYLKEYKEVKNELLVRKSRIVR